MIQQNSPFQVYQPFNLRHVQALVSCIPKAGQWGMCQRLWLFSCVLSDQHIDGVHGGIVATIKTEFIFYQPSLPDKIRLAVPKTKELDLNPYLVIQIPKELQVAVGAGYVDSETTLKGIYSSSLADLA
jgi:hypothetical protein